jgi:excisionase family DNA binding protein
MVARMTDQPLLYSIPEAARRLAVSRSTIYRLIKDGALLTMSVRSQQRVTAKSLAKYVEQGERSRRLAGVRP